MGRVWLTLKDQAMTGHGKRGAESEYVGEEAQRKRLRREPLLGKQSQHGRQSPKGTHSVLLRSPSATSPVRGMQDDSSLANTSNVSCPSQAPQRTYRKAHRKKMVASAKITRWFSSHPTTPAQEHPATPASSPASIILPTPTSAKTQQRRRQRRRKKTSQSPFPQPLFPKESQDSPSKEEPVDPIAMKKKASARSSDADPTHPTSTPAAPSRLPSSCKPQDMEDAQAQPFRGTGYGSLGQDSTLEMKKRS